MQELETVDTTTASYWLNGRFLLCAIWVLLAVLIATFLIWKYEGLEDSESEIRRPVQGRSWKPCVKEIHPIILMFFRIVSFCLLFVALSFDVQVHGFELFFYYTQWTFTLTTIYFGLGSIHSIVGCFHLRREIVSDKCQDVEQHLEARLLEKSDNPGKSHSLLRYDFWDELFQVLYPMIAGAITITDVIYWTLIFPFVTLRDYEKGFLTVVAHSLNAVLLLGETALNSLPCPWYRASYFFIWTSVYVVFQWIVHACESIWWPYPFLDLSAPAAPWWYLMVAAMHFPCYGLVLLIVNLKYFVISRCFPYSYTCV